jgi:hypothetical protein
MDSVSLTMASTAFCKPPPESNAALSSLMCYMYIRNHSLVLNTNNPC